MAIVTLDQYVRGMSEILVEEKQGVVWVTINRPEVRNALSRPLNLKLQEVAAKYDEQYESVRALVITGAGDKAFSAGADLKERKSVAAEESLPYVTAIRTAIRAWGDLK